jgi:hypothetical protein
MAAAHAPQKTVHDRPAATAAAVAYARADIARILLG